MRKFKKIVVSMFIMVSFFLILPVTISANEEETIKEFETTERRAAVKVARRNYSYKDASGVLEITYSINTTTGKIHEILSAEMVNVTPGKTVRLSHISFSGNTVTVSIDFDNVCQYDSFELH